MKKKFLACGLAACAALVALALPTKKAVQAARPIVAELMADAIQMQNWERYEKKLYGLECIACGCCTYICPARRPLTQIFKQTKAEIMARKRAEQAGGKK